MVSIGPLNSRAHFIVGCEFVISDDGGCVTLLEVIRRLGVGDNAFSSICTDLGNKCDRRVR
jgi:hypothetical protein